MLNLSKDELIAFAKKKKTISEYKSMSKDELITAINTPKPIKNNKKVTRRIFLNQKEKKSKKVSTNHQKRNFLNQK